jgi:hypothetical protein
MTEDENHPAGEREEEKLEETGPTDDADTDETPPSPAPGRALGGGVGRGGTPGGGAGRT